MDLAGKRVVVQGMKASGRAAAALAVSKGAEVVGVDLQEVPPVDGVRLEIGPHNRDTFLGADLIVVSPGVPATQPDLAAAAAAGVQVLGELAFAAHFLDQPMAAITGTNGKSTVTAFTGQLLEGARLRPFVGGNLGNPLSNAVGGDWDVLVVEVSSYQLEWGAVHPHVGAILNLTPDHLARHGDMDGYAEVKCRLFSHMGRDDWALLPWEDERLRRHASLWRLPRRVWLDRTPGVQRIEDRAIVEVEGVRAALDLSVVPIPGDHNRSNAAVAAMVALLMGAAPDIVQAGLTTLEALDHRMQVVAQRGGITWIDDSKATNIEAAAMGIGGLGRTAVVLIGGQAKGNGFGALAPLLAQHRATITFGDSGPAIADELVAAGLHPVRATDLENAVRCARQLAHSGDAVLLSPGCASFDAFTDFADRGRVFAALARQEEPS